MHIAILLYNSWVCARCPYQLTEPQIVPDVKLECYG